jgi:hypothetical protein
MFEVIYFTNADRTRLQLLQEQVTFVRDAEERERMEQEIASILSRKKPLQECDLEECGDLRTQLYRKYQQLQGIGKFGMASQYKMQLRAVEGRRQVLFLEQQKESEERAKEAAMTKAEQMKRKQADDTGKPQVTPRTGGSRWTFGTGELD